MEADSVQIYPADPASAIREVFSYISRFQDKIFILKIEDSLLDHPVFPVLMNDVAQLHKTGIRIIIVPGARKTIDRHLERFGMDTVSHQGIRITPRDSLPIVELSALEVSQRILSHLTANGVSGLQGNWIQASSMGVLDGVDYQGTGRIEYVNSQVINKLLGEGFVPILPNIGWNKLGKPYNINSNELATALCKRLSIAKLFFIGLEDGIRPEGLQLEQLKSECELTPQGIISSLELNDARILLESNSGVLDYNRRDYLRNAIRACEAGALRVHLVSGLTQGSLLQEVFSSRGEGTMIYANEYSSVRTAREEDITAILRIMQDHINSGKLIARNEKEIYRELKNYVVYEVDTAIHGCGALFSQDDQHGEIGAIAVDSTYHTSGIGRTIVRYLLLQAKKRNYKSVFLLTTQAGDWFYSLGFEEGSTSHLPEWKAKSYNQKRNSKILIHTLKDL